DHIWRRESRQRIGLRTHKSAENQYQKTRHPPTPSVGATPHQPLSERKTKRAAGKMQRANMPAVLPAELLEHCFGAFEKGLRRRAVRLRHDNRQAAVAAHAHLRKQW